MEQREQRAKTSVAAGRSRLLIGFAIAAIGGIAWWQFGAHRTERDTAGIEHSVQAPLPVTMQPVALTTVPLEVEVTGTVQPELYAPIASKVMGRVQAVLVHEGDAVRRGQTLITLDSRDLDASVAQAGANLRAAGVGLENARVTARMEASLSAARIAEAQSKVAESEAALRAAEAKLQLAKAGPRPQEREQAALTVAQARSGFTLAESNLRRMGTLYQEGAISAQQYDTVRSQFDVAKAQLEVAQQGRSIADEGSRAEEIRAAEQAVRQAQASVQQARAGLNSARASALQADVRRQEIQSAVAQIGQSRAALRLASVTRDYTVITAPIDGRVAKRLADPGAMAGPGVPLLAVQGSRLQLNAIVPESALAAVRKGAALTITFDALRSRKVTGRVAEIAPQGDPSSHTFVVKIDLPPSSGAVAGIFGRARLTTGTERRLLIPSGAVIEREGLKYVCTVDERSVARLRMVTVGDVFGGRTVVLSGLNAGENVVATGGDALKDGVPVRLETR